MQSSVPSSAPLSAGPRQLSPAFFERPALWVARHLLGKWLLHSVEDQILALEIVEVEAYLGSDDPASHAARGPTPRNRVMFERGGTCYVYFTYGMYHCMNVVTGLKGQAEAVLLRAGIPRRGLGCMHRLRGVEARPGSERLLLSGPAKLTQAIGVDLKLNGSVYNQGPLSIVDVGTDYPDEAVATSPRIGIRQGTDLLFRFTLAGSPFLSRKR